MEIPDIGIDLDDDSPKNNDKSAPILLEQQKSSPLEENFIIHHVDKSPAEKDKKEFNFFSEEDEAIKPLEFEEAREDNEAKIEFENPKIDHV